MGAPVIGRRADETRMTMAPPAAPDPGVPADLPAGQTREMTTVDDLAAAAPLNRPPDPPNWLLKTLTAKGLMYRWLSVPQMRQLGKRGYTVYSPDTTERNRIDRGDCPAGVHVDEANTVRFLDDAVLGVLSKARWEQRRRDVTRRTHDQTELAMRGQGAQLAEQARRMGGRLTAYTSESWEQKGE